MNRVDVVAHGAVGPWDEVLLVLPLGAVVLAFVFALRKPKHRPDGGGAGAESAPERAASEPAAHDGS